MDKLSWTGFIASVQPRIRLTRSFDEFYHNYLGYCLFVEGVIGDQSRQFSIGIGKITQQKHQFQAGDEVSGQAITVKDPRLEPVEFYRASKLMLLNKSDREPPNPPPWLGVPPDLETYRWRGHRRLSARTYNSKCTTCMWGCRMPVEMIIDPWNPSMRYRFETFCYGPKSCEFYKPGPRRVVPGRKGMSWEEPDWLDEEATAHREIDE